MIEGASVRRLFVGEVSLEVTEAGPASGRPVVLLHGFPECAHSWRHQIRALANAGYRVIAPDQRGYNHSDKPTPLSAYRIDHLAGDVIGLLDALSLPRAHIVGHDWGGVVAWAVASLYPGRVERLVAMNGPHPRHARHVILTNPRQLRRAYYMFVFQLPGIAERVMLRPGFIARAMRGSATQKSAIDDESIAIFTAALHQPGAPRAMLSWYRAAMRLRMPALPPVLARTMVIWGDRDLALLPVLSHPPERYVRDLEIRHVPDAGHWVQQERPEVVNRHMLEFLAR
jgi:pimeloyl-ACP methyl ester carboxylesterase